MKKEKRKTLTYYGKPSIRKKAIRMAKKDGKAFGELVDNLLERHVLQIPSIDLNHEFSMVVGPSPD
jgi:hypothetical protein